MIRKSSPQFLRINSTNQIELNAGSRNFSLNFDDGSSRFFYMKHGSTSHRIYSDISKILRVHSGSLQVGLETNDSNTFMLNSNDFLAGGIPISMPYLMPIGDWDMSSDEEIEVTLPTTIAGGMFGLIGVIRDDANQIYTLFGFNGSYLSSWGEVSVYIDGSGSPIKAHLSVYNLSIFASTANYNATSYNQGWLMYFKTTTLPTP
jgi:hypothetical protein